MTATASARICKRRGDVAITSAGIGWSLRFPLPGTVNAPLVDYYATVASHGDNNCCAVFQGRFGSISPCLVWTPMTGRNGHRRADDHVPIETHHRIRNDRDNRPTLKISDFNNDAARITRPLAARKGTRLP